MLDARMWLSCWPKLAIQIYGLKMIMSYYVRFTSFRTRSTNRRLLPVGWGKVAHSWSGGYITRLCYIGQGYRALVACFKLEGARLLFAVGHSTPCLFTFLHDCASLILLDNYLYIYILRPNYSLIFRLLSFLLCVSISSAKSLLRISSRKLLSIGVDYAFNHQLSC